MHRPSPSLAFPRLHSPSLAYSHRLSPSLGGTWAASRRQVLPHDAFRPHLTSIAEHVSWLEEHIVEEAVPVTIEMLPTEQAERELNKVQENFDFSVFTDPEVRIVGVAHFRCPCGGTHGPSKYQS